MDNIAVILAGIGSGVTAVILWKCIEKVSGFLESHARKPVAAGGQRPGNESRTSTVVVALTEDHVRAIRHCLDSEAMCYDALLAERGSSMSEAERTKAFAEAARHREMARRLAMAAENAKAEPERVFDMDDETLGRQGS